MSTFNRKQWGARPQKNDPGSLRRAQVIGIALHWPAINKPIRGVKNVCAALRGWQDFHIDGRGWSDIAYQEAIDQDGNVYSLRGLTTKSAANGDADLNSRYGALLLILAPGEQPTEAMVQTVRNRIAVHRKTFPLSRRIVGHGQIRPGGTECPGPILQSYIDRGAFMPVPDPALETRGPVVDGAIAGLQKAKPSKKNAAKVKAALDALRAIKPWSKK